MKRRSMRLTPELVAGVPPATGNYSAEEIMRSAREAAETDHREVADAILAGAPSPDDVWVFAYGSLIWNPEFDFVEKRTARLNGWHRSFCLGWDKWFRGSVERPGLMLALDRGGSCSGVAFRLPPAAAAQNLLTLVRREVHLLPHPFPPRWVGLRTPDGPLRAVTFAMDRRSYAYVGRLGDEQVADALALAAGQWGSMAEYLFNTVSRLDELGLHDTRLWRLQELVAERIEAMQRPA